MQLTIADLQAYLAEHYRAHANGVDTNLFMKLVEEVGEVAEVLNKRSGRKMAGAENLDEELAKELADVLHYTVALAAINDIDLTQVVLAKDKTAAIKYQHKQNLAEFLTKKQGDKHDSH